MYESSTSVTRASNDPSTHYAPTAAEGTKVGGPRRSHSEKIEQTRALRALLDGRSVVYAVQFPDSIIKIGCTMDLSRRHRRFRSADGVIVGFKFGDYADEQALHAELAPYRAHGREWYHPTADVLAVVNAMRDGFNLPHIAA